MEIVSKIKGGYYIKARKICNSEVYHAPPAYREIWEYILANVAYQEEIQDLYNVSRGNGFFTCERILEDLSWNVGYKKLSYGKSQAKHAIRFFKNKKMITVQKKPRGMIITVENYNFYQNPKNYMCSTERTNERTTETLTKEPQDNAANTLQSSTCNGKEKHERTTEIATKEPTKEPTLGLSITKEERIKNNTNIYSPLFSEEENAVEQGKEIEPEKKPERDVFDYWNIKETIVHRDFSKFSPSINESLKHYKPEEIKTAIDNYAVVLKDRKYYWSHSWTLDQFLQRKGAIDKFLPDNFKEEEFYCQEYKEHLKGEANAEKSDRLI